MRDGQDVQARIEDRESQLERRAQRIDELDRDVEDLRAERDELAGVEEDLQAREEEIATLEEELSTQEEQIQTLQSNLESQRDALLEQLSDQYESPAELFRAATNWLETANAEMEAERYHEAARLYAGASRYFDTTAYIFEELRATTNDMELDQAVTIVDSAANGSIHLREAAIALSDAARYFGLGDEESAQEAPDRADQQSQAAENYDTAELATFEDALGL